MHSPPADPNALLYMNARDNASLRELAQARLPMIKARCDALNELLADNEAAKIRVSEKTRQFWQLKKLATEKFLEVYAVAETPADALDGAAREKREIYFKNGIETWGELKHILLQLNQEIIGPYVLGDQLSLADLHLAAWLARLVMLSGGSISDDGNTAIGKLEAHITDGFSLQKDLSVAEARRRAGLPIPDPETSERQNRLAAFWDTIKERPSFKKVYTEGLH